MWPQMLHLAQAGRADAVIRLESVAADSLRLERLLESSRKLKLPPAAANCSMAEIHVNEGTVLHESLDNHTQMGRVLARSPDLQRRVCAFYYHDFVCGGYELLD